MTFMTKVLIMTFMTLIYFHLALPDRPGGGDHGGRGGRAQEGGQVGSDGSGGQYGAACRGRHHRGG